MTLVSRAVLAALLTVATAAPCFAQPKDKPLPEPLPMGVPYYYQPGNNYWYSLVVTDPYWAGKPRYTTTNAPPGTYYTIYPATRPVVVWYPSGPVLTTERTAPVVVGPTWALTPVKTAQTFSYYPR